MWLVRAGALLILALTLAENVEVGNPAVALWSISPSQRRVTAERLIASVPSQAPLAVTNHVGPLAGRRTGFYFFPPHTFYTSDPMKVADYILIDQKSDGGGDSFQAALQTLQQSPRWKMLADRDGYLLFSKISKQP